MTTVELCGPPLAVLVTRSVFLIAIRLHSSDPDSELHAEIHIYLHPASGVFRIVPEWVL